MVSICQLAYEIEVVNKKTGSKERHVTTIAGPQAAAILSILGGTHVITHKNKRVEGLPIVEVWVDVTQHVEDFGLV